MRNKREYVKPTVKVMELNSNVALLQSSATLQGYQYQGNTNDEGWE
jgi:hypothetical protein